MHHLVLDYKGLILIYSSFALFSAYFARKESRNPYLWFFLGLTLGVVSLILLLFLNFKNNIKKKPAIQAPLSKGITHKKKFQDTKSWYYLNKENKQLGPMSSTKLYSLYKEGTISQATYIWNEEFDDWKYLKDTELYNLFFSEKNAV